MMSACAVRRNPFAAFAIENNLRPLFHRVTFGLQQLNRKREDSNDHRTGTRGYS